MKLKTKIGIISLGIIVLLVIGVDIYWIVSKEDTLTLVEEKGEIGEKDLQLQKIINELGEHQFSTHYYKMVEDLSKQDKPVVPLLIKLLKHKKSNVRCFAAHALGKIRDKSSVPYLIEAIKNECPDVRCAIAQALTDIDIKDRHVQQTLKKLLKDEVWEVRSYTVEAIGLEKDNSFIYLIIKLLKNDPQPYVRSMCVKALGRIKDKSSTYTLIEIFGTLKDEDKWIQSYIIEALREIKDERAIPFLTKCLKDENIANRIDAAEALGKMDIKSGIPILVEALKNKDFYYENITIREKAALILGDIGDESVILNLKKLLNDSNNYVRETARETIEKIYSKIEKKKEE